NPDGSTTFYTRAADQARDPGALAIGTGFQIEDWTMFMKGLENRVQEGGGSVQQGVDFPPTIHYGYGVPDLNQQGSGSGDGSDDDPDPIYDYRITYHPLGQPNKVTTLVGTTDSRGQYSAFLPPGVIYSVSLYNPLTKLYGTGGGLSGASGAVTN